MGATSSRLRVRFDELRPLPGRGSELVLDFLVDLEDVVRRATVIVDPRTSRIEFPHLVWESGLSLGAEELDEELIAEARALVKLFAASGRWPRPSLPQPQR